MVAYVASATFVMQDGYGASPQLFAILFGVNALAMVAGNQVNAHLLHRFSPSTLTAPVFAYYFSGRAAYLSSQSAVPG